MHRRWIQIKHHAKKQRELRELQNLINMENITKIKKEKLVQKIVDIQIALMGCMYDSSKTKLGKVYLDLGKIVKELNSE